MSENEKNKKLIIVFIAVFLVLVGLIVALLLLRSCDALSVRSGENEFAEVDEADATNEEIDETDGTQDTDAVETSALSVTPADMPNPDSKSGVEEVKDTEPAYTVFDPFPTQVEVHYYVDYGDGGDYSSDDYSWIYSAEGSGGSSSGGSSSGGGYSGTGGSPSSAGGGGGSIGGGTSTGGGPGGASGGGPGA